MADFLTAVKSVRTQKENEPESFHLTSVTSTDTRTKHGANKTDELATTGAQRDVKTSAGATKKLPQAPEEVLQFLRTQPDLDQLATTLNRLRNQRLPGNFNIHAPGPVQAQIINVLLNKIVPDFWPVLKSNSATPDLIVCLQNIAGLNAIIARLRLLSSQKVKDIADDSQSIQDLLDVAERLLSGAVFLSAMWTNLQVAVADPLKLDMLWKELVNIVGSGKAIAAAALAEDALRASAKDRKKSTWLANGPEYASWLGNNLASLVRKDLNTGNPSRNLAGAAAQLLAKALNLGYPGQFLNRLFGSLLSAEIDTKTSQSEAMATLLQMLPAHVKRSFTEHLLRWLSNLRVTSTKSNTSNVLQRSNDVLAISGFLSHIIDMDDGIKHRTISFLSDPALSSLLPLSVRRSCICALSSNAEDDLQILLEKVMSKFSDQIFINHAPILQQEALTQTILLVAGYVHSTTPMALLMAARSSNHMQGVSNRLDSSNPRARWLGMVVGMALSSLVDKEGSKMSFGTDEMETEEAKWYMSLVKVQDHAGTLKDFNTLLQAQNKAIKSPKPTGQPTKVEQMPKINGKAVFGPPRPPLAQTEVIGEKVTELSDSDEDEDEDLKPYAKPDSDPEDSDEDATLVNRNKARPPVYIRDLIAMLRDDKNHDRFQLGIKHAAGLIRRKATFGAEVKDHAEELAGILGNMQDPFDTENFDEMKLQALIALLLSDVKTIGPWLSRQAFVGEYSIAQRCTILSALGLGGRELAGFKNDDELNPAINNTEFASKRLPPRLHSIYSPPVSSTKRLESTSKSLENALIKPLALHAADQSTAQLNAVKVRTFSSRMEMERTKRKPAPNQLAKIFGEQFFFPLANRYQQEIGAYGSASVFSSVSILLVTFLKTLALLLHASGPATLGLPQISAEFWDLLLSLRVQAIGDISVLQAVLFSLLTLLEINDGDKRRIAEENPKQLMETQRWVDMVFERMNGGGGLVSESGNEDEAKVRTLAAGVLVKTGGVIEAYRKQLVGYTGD